LKNVFFVFVISFFCFKLAFSAECIKRRAVFDLGASSTKIYVRDVNVCDSKVSDRVFSDAVKVQYREDLFHSKGNVLSPAIQEEGTKAIEGFLLKTKELNPPPSEYLALGMSAFRLAKNAKSYFKGLEKKLKIPFRVISQNKEAELAYLGVGYVNPSEEFSVWDVGGGSAQIIYKHKGKMQFLNFNWGSDVFKNWIYKNIKKNTKLETPNPMSGVEIEETLKLFQKVLKKEIGNKHISFIKNHKIMVVGRFFNNGFEGLAEGGILTKAKILSELKMRQGLNDKDLEARIKSSYYTSAVSNILLTLSFMEILGLDKLHVTNVESSEGVLFHPQSWKNLVK